MWGQESARGIVWLSEIVHQRLSVWVLSRYLGVGKPINDYIDVHSHSGSVDQCKSSIVFALFDKPQTLCFVLLISDIFQSLASSKQLQNKKIYQPKTNTHTHKKRISWVGHFTTETLFLHRDVKQIAKPLWSLCIPYSLLSGSCF